MTISAVLLNAENPRILADFYVSHLGMAVTAIETQHDKERLFLGFGGQGAQLALGAASGDHHYTYRDTNPFWKIGITLPDVTAAYQQLRRSDIEVSEPAQFRDIGFMCHLSDPEGFQIELLQHTFEDQPGAAIGDLSLPLGGGAQLGQVTLRVTDIDAALSYYCDKIGMRVLSIQPVSSLNFTLYFLAFTDETPPDDGLESVSNRPWLWQRPYTILELQHLHARPVIDSRPHNGAGFEGIRITPSGDSRAFIVRSHHTGARHLA